MTTKYALLPCITLLLLGPLGCDTSDPSAFGEEARVFELDGEAWSRVDTVEDALQTLRSGSQELCTCTVGDGHTVTEGIYDSVGAAQDACLADTQGCGDSTATLECTTVNQSPGRGAKM